MAKKQGKPDKVRARADVKTKGEVNKPRPDAAGLMKSMRLSLFEVPDYRIKDGFPREPPNIDVRSTAYASANGLTVAYRPEPRAVETTADVRWIADDELFNEEALTWMPWRSDVGGMKFTGGEIFSPSFIKRYEYRVGKELFAGTAVNFDADTCDHMLSDFGSAMSGAVGYTLIMVLSLNSVFGNSEDDDEVRYTGIWCPGNTTPVNKTDFDEPVLNGISLLLQGRYLWVHTPGNKEKTVAVADLMARTAPMYLAMVVGHPQTHVYVGPGPDKITKGSAFTGEDETPFTNQIALGRTNGSVQRCTDMAIFDMGLYADRLSKEQIKREFSKLASIYGGEK